MATFSIVEHFDVLEQISTGFLAGSVANPVYTLALEGTEEALHDSIVIAVILPEKTPEPSHIQAQAEWHYEPTSGFSAKQNPGLVTRGI